MYFGWKLLLPVSLLNLVVDGAVDRGEASMSIPFIMFFVFALVAVGGAIMLIFAREPIHSALALILVMVSLAALYLLLGAEFIAAVQVIVYAGAIMVLFVFVIMLLNAGVEERTNFSQDGEICRAAAGDFSSLWAGALDGAFSHRRNGCEWSGSAESAAVSTSELSTMLFQKYLFPFEATSILILIAILGAVVLAKRGTE